jgi:parallel beta-helix repeat protein
MLRPVHALLVGWFVSSPPAAAQDAPPAVVERPTVVVRQSGAADVVGNDDQALETALRMLRQTGGTLVVGPGRYVIRRALFLPADVVLRGEEGALLPLPSPALLTEPAAAGTHALVLDRDHELAADTRVQLVPPEGSEHFADGVSRALELQPLTAVDGRKVVLAEPLPFDLPPGTRIGYPHKLLWLNKEGRTTIEGLAFEGGRTAGLPMPGHSQRCAIWASAPFGFGEERLGPPGEGLVVRRCTFTDFYGRPIAIYHHRDGRIEDCRMERIDDEAIDLDHFVEGFTVARNVVREALWGIVLNDASRNVIEDNVIEDCGIGIWSWRYENVPAEGYNEANVIRRNRITGSRERAIQIEQHCVRYVIQENEIEGSIVVVEAENTVGPNTQLDAPDEDR